MPKREKDDLRVHILAEAGALERQGHPSWPQRESFIAQTQRAKSVEELVECARQLEEAAFDWWTPALDSGCPCCDKRTIEPSLSVPQMLSKLRDFIWEYAEFAQLEERTDPNYDLEEQIGALVWARFHEVDLDNSGFGYCSLTASCAEEPHYMAWKRSHRETCQACRPRHVGEPLGDGDFARLSRLRFAEGLSQVLGLRMPWISLRSLVDELSRGDAHGRIAFENFVVLAVRSKKPRERQLVALSLRRLAVPFWSALEREGAQTLCNETATLSRAKFLTFCKEIGAPTLDRESLEAIFGDVGYSDGTVLRVQAFWRDIALLNIARLTKRLPKNASGPAAKLLRARIAFATRFVNHLNAESL